jgi:RNA polymerase sigma-70 factor (ECF subfamily)
MSTESHDDDRAHANHQLFEREIACHRRRLFPTALRLTGSPHDAEDLIQETMTRAYVGLDHFTPGTNARAWLFRIMSNCFLSGCRKRRREPLQVLSADTDAQQTATAMTDTGGTIGIAPSAEQEVLGQFAHSELRQVLAELPQCFRATIYLADIEGYACKDVAEILGISIGTVMSRLHRARIIIKRQLSRSSRAQALLNQCQKWPKSTDSVV